MAKEYPIVDSVESFEAALARVRAAQKVYATYTQEQVDKIFKAAALAANNMQNNLTSSNIVGMIIMCLCPLSLGFSLNLLFAQLQATATLRQRLDREHTARHLHDTISNDLAYMILRIDQASRSDCPADREQYQRQLTDLRAIAETALDHTHQVIRQLERTDKPDDRSRIVKTNNDDKTDRKI